MDSSDSFHFRERVNAPGVHSLGVFVFTGPSPRYLLVPWAHNPVR